MWKWTVAGLCCALLWSAGCSRHQEDVDAAKKVAEAFVKDCSAGAWDKALKRVYPRAAMRASIVDGEVRPDLQEACGAVKQPLDVDGSRFDEDGDERRVTLQVELQDGDQQFLIVLIKKGDDAYAVSNLQVAR